MAPFAVETYRQRQSVVFARMQQRRIHALFLPPSGDLEYLTGFRRRKAVNTDIVQPADWLYGVLMVPGFGTYVVSPFMVSNYVRSHVADKPWLKDVVFVPEHEDPMSFLAALPRRFGLTGLAGFTLAVGNRTWAETAFGFSTALPGLRVVPAGDLVSLSRQVKTDAELALMRKAAEIADRAFEAVLPRLVPGVTDLEVVTEVDYQLQLHGAEHTSFPTGITFSGSKDQRDPHESREVGPPARVRLERGMHIAFDFGAVYEGYCSDFGRTVFCGEPDAEHRRIHALVMEAQAAGMAAMKSGQATGADADKAARDVLRAAGYGEFFWHRLGHGIGCDVHEPIFLTASERRQLASGMTFTVEPSVLKQGIAIRVEDVALVTPEGGQSLNRATHDLVIV
jgi:Xaa-Pro aminopeptidase